MHAGGNRSVPMCAINTTPLVDVMLVLLVAPILSLPIMSEALKGDMPAPDRPPEIVDVDIYNDGAISLNGEAIMSMPQLEQQFMESAPSSPNSVCGLRSRKS
jgi:biopolymer transport protein ExbD